MCKLLLCDSHYFHNREAETISAVIAAFMLMVTVSVTIKTVQYNGLICYCFHGEGLNKLHVL